MKGLVGLLLIGVMVSGMAWAEEESAITPVEGIERILEHYLPIRSALASNTLKGVKEDAGHIIEMADELAKIKHDTTEEEDKKYQAKIANIKAQAEKLKGDKIESVRSAFSDLSNALIDCLSKCSPPEKEYYVFYCSMLKKYWLQEDKKVGNPYGGPEMLKCGGLAKDKMPKGKEIHTGHK